MPEHTFRIISTEDGIKTEPCNQSELIEGLEPDGWYKWHKVYDRLPEAGKPVIAFVNPNEYGKKRSIRAMWTPAKTLEQHPDADGGEYDEATDEYYCKEGWYETNEYEEVHWNVSGVVTHWTELPKPPLF